MPDNDVFRTLNQPKPWSGYNAFHSDPLLGDLTRNLARPLREEFDTIGRYVTSPEAQELAQMANTSLPQLKTHGPAGERLDTVAFHPAWHALLRRSMSSGLHSSLWEPPRDADSKSKAHKLRAVRLFLTAQLECGHLEPLSATSASLAVLAATPQLRAEWAPKILSRKYDSTNRPQAQKTAATVGLAITEKQAGSDTRALTTKAARVSEGVYRLSGHKWFVSAPMSDAFIMLADVDGKPGCFLVPRLLDEGRTNALRYQRLKDKLGLRSNAAAEIEFSDAFGFLLGAPDTGLRTILDMLTLMRLDSAVMASGLMRAALAEATHAARGRSVHGKALVSQPLMMRVLADLALDVAAAGALSFRLAESFDRARDSAEEAAYARVMTPVTKYWTTKIAPAVVAEAMEAMGGNGFIEDRPITRHYRDAPGLAMHDGAGNMMALDLRRVVEHGSDLFEAVFQLIARDLGASGAKIVELLRAAMALCKTHESAARIFIEQLALAAGAAELYRLGAGRIADAFLETRLAAGWRSTYGMLDTRFDASYVVELLFPEMD
ncbi:acyl-CoA dehydrogenase family protein [Martelella sp. AD-3]|uniref:acyl-CoA dehydrogenase family protein n=1 Tax=Martelella sp. AD-3 TaxID=686597 RepID=UPI000465162B|nr:acyl-CoA dehydrogenase family protein [Martelella sp. AD-3]AMM85293.1 acyl-CoA dehydrogenase [Martelella sp. AD-3]MAM09988.1 acyl-CoA dehydrogenase [Rhizobiaceae bacterium]